MVVDASMCTAAQHASLSSLALWMNPSIPTLSFRRSPRFPVRHPTRRVIHSRSTARAVEIGARSAKRLNEAVDQPIELPVLGPLLLDLLDRVDHGRMMLPAEALADLGKGAHGELLAEVHRRLP